MCTTNTLLFCQDVLTQPSSQQTWWLAKENLWGPLQLRDPPPKLAGATKCQDTECGHEEAWPNPGRMGSYALTGGGLGTMLLPFSSHGLAGGKKL